MPPTPDNPFHRYASSISFLGLLLVAVTFLVNDIVREDLKEKVALFESAKTQWILRRKLEAIQDSLKSGRQEFNPPNLSDFPSTVEGGKRFISAMSEWLLSIYSNIRDYSETAHLLYNPLSKRLRRQFGPIEKRIRTGLEGGYVLYFETLLGVAFREQHSQPAQETAEWELAQFQRVSESYLEALKEINLESVHLSEVFEKELVSLSRHFRTLRYVSYYLLYPLGVLIGIFGQLAGVKAPGQD